ncbi:MAG: hypothetical protein WKF81_01820 [Thermomicrobiales bacterium]
MEQRDAVHNDELQSPDTATTPDVTDPRVQERTNSGVTREIIWIVISGALLIYLFALPIRIQYWRFDFIAESFRELRRWMLIRDIWAFQLQNPPSFGNEPLVQVLLVLSVIVMLGGFIYGLRLVLMQDELKPPVDRANVG